MSPAYQRWLLLALTAVVLGACTGSRVTAPPSLSDDFKPSDVDHRKIAAMINQDDVSAVRGSAKVQFSAPGNSERGTARFIADRNNMLVTIRGNLGITGAHILASADSVTLYYVLDKMAWKMSVEDYETDPDIQMRLPLNLMDLLCPHIQTRNIRKVTENATHYLVHLHSDAQLLIHKDGKRLEMMKYLSEKPESFSEFVYESHAEMAGILLPRRVTVLSGDRSSRIRLDIGSLEVNPPKSELRFVLEIPQGVPIYR